MNETRIWLELSALCADARKQSCILLDHEKLKTVEDVKNHISRVFGIRQTFHLLNEGWFLPSSESSRILRDNETVSVVPDECCELVPKNLGQINENKPEQTITDNVPQESNGTDGSVRPGFPENHESNLQNQSISMDVVENKSPENEERRVKRVRRRNRRAKAHNEPILKEKDATLSPYIQNKYIQGVGHIVNPSLNAINTKHIFFKEEPVEEPVAGSQSHSDGNIEQRFNVPNCLPPSNPVTSDFGGPLSKLMSLGSAESPVVFERKKLQTFTTASVFNGRNKEEKAKICSEVKLTPLKELPTKGTFIKFRILKMCNYSPSVSGSISARVISSDFSSNHIHVEITDGLDEFRNEKGKFSLEEDEDDTAPSPTMFLNWTDILEPQLVEYH